MVSCGCDSGIGPPLLDMILGIERGHDHSGCHTRDVRDYADAGKTKKECSQVLSSASRCWIALRAALLVAKRNHRIDMRRAAGRHEAGRQTRQQHPIIFSTVKRTAMRVYMPVVFAAR